MAEGNVVRKFARLISLSHRETRQAVRRVLEDHGVQMKLRDLLSFDENELRLLANRAEMLRNSTGLSLKELGIENRERLRNFLLNEKNFNDLITVLHAAGKLQTRGYTLQEGKVVFQGAPKDVLALVRSGLSPEEVKKRLGVTGMAASLSRIYQRYRLDRLRHLRPDEYGAIKIRVNNSEFRFHINDPAQLAREIEERMRDNPEAVKTLIREIRKAHQAALAQELLKKLRIEKIKIPGAENETTPRIDVLFRLHEKGINPFLLARAYMEAKKLLEQKHIRAFEGGTHLIIERRGAGEREEIRRIETPVNIHGLAHYFLEGFSHDMVGTFNERTRNILETFKDLGTLQDAIRSYLNETKQRAAVNVELFDVDHEKLLKSAVTGLFLEEHGRNLLEEFERLIEKHKSALAQRIGSLSKLGALPEDPDSLATYLKTHIRSMSAEELDELARILDCLESGVRCRATVEGDLTEKLRKLLGYRNRSYKPFYARFGVYKTLPEEIKEEVIRRFLQKHPELLTISNNSPGRLRILAQELKEALRPQYNLRLRAIPPS